MKTWRVSGLDELAPVAKELAEEAVRARILTFSGDLGAGKTTLIQRICFYLGVTEPVTSPSFGLVNEYESPLGPVYHFDLYRIRDEREALDLGFLEYLDSGYICLIEWPEIVERILPEFIALKLELKADGSRVILANRP